MNRPIITRVDTQASPPTMQLLFVEHDVPLREISVRIRSPLAGRRASVVAGMELAAFDAEQLQLLYESATVIPGRPDPVSATAAAAGGMIERVYQEPRATHPVYCPACCHKLCRADSPAIGYIKKCPACERSIRIAFVENTLTIVLGQPRAG